MAAIPESDTEAGGVAGQEALERIEHTFGRMEAVWKPVGVQEGFEIVRRRLFGAVKDPEALEQTCLTYSRLYGDAGSGDFPRECADASYLERLRRAYPIHPEVFDRLYDDWATLERFQRTRGVLRLMAAVIHELWVREDHSLLIQPGTVPIDAPRVRDELLRYLPEGWNTVIDRDVDGERSTPRAIDEGNARLGQHAAARRVARTIFQGSAPHVAQQRVRGIEDVRVRLGVAQPGEPIAVFTDAVGRLLDHLTYLYSGDRRYWYDTHPNLRRTAEDYASRLEGYEVEAEIERRLQQSRERADFKAVHVCPVHGDVPDEQYARLIVLRADQAHRRDRQDSAAVRAASAILEKHGPSPRIFRNMLVFIAPDEESVGGLDQEVRRFLAWQSIVKSADELNLDAHQRRQAADTEKRTDQTVAIRLQEAYSWLLVPVQEEGTGPQTWEATRISGGSESLVLRAARKLRGAEQLIISWSPALLRMELDRWLWRDPEQPHLGTQKLWGYLATYPYLPRLVDADVLTAAIAEGLRSRDYFGYATSVGSDGRYEGLVFGQSDFAGTVHLDPLSVVVKPDAATAQIEADRRREEEERARRGQITIIESPSPGSPDEPPVVVAAQPLRRFHGTVDLDAARVSRDADDIAQEIVQHLAGLANGRIKVTLEIEAESPDGFPEHVVRIVSENARTLKFKSQGFEPD